MTTPRFCDILITKYKTKRGVVMSVYQDKDLLRRIERNRALLYNAELKNEFINSGTNSLQTIQLMVQIFSIFTNDETKHHCDLSQFPKEILEPIINGRLGLKGKTIDRSVKVLKDYVTWCKDTKGIETSNAVFEIVPYNIDKYRRQMVGSPKHLKDVLDNPIYGFDPPEKHTIDITYRVFLWMAFAGLKEIDALKVTKNDVDLSRLEIHLDGRTFEIYKECKEDFELACNLESFSVFRSGYEMNMPRAAGDLILRGITNEQVSLQTIRSVVNMALSGHRYLQKICKQEAPRKRNRKPSEQELKIVDMIDNQHMQQSEVARSLNVSRQCVHNAYHRYKRRESREADEQPEVEIKANTYSYTRLYLSGVYYRAYEKERIDKLTPSFDEEAKYDIAKWEEQHGRKYKTSSSRSEQSIVNNKCRERLKDYQQWKKAFA